MLKKEKNNISKKRKSFKKKKNPHGIRDKRAILHIFAILMTTMYA